jgi:diaminopropionate ammonia-lyase
MRAASRDHRRTIVFTTASSGNHGRSVAAGAKLFGNRCIIFLPKFTSAEKEAAIRDRGAEVVRVDGDYDRPRSPSAAARPRPTAGRSSPTPHGTGYEDTPRDVMRGYTVLVEEVIRQWRPGPTHVFVQAGVGGWPPR